MFFSRRCRTSICVLPSYLHILRLGKFHLTSQRTLSASMAEVSPELPNYLEEFLARNQDNVQARTILHGDIPLNALIVKSLLWTHQRVNPVLVVLDLRSSVDKTKLAKYLNTQPKHMRMATPELVIEVTGQTVGNVSPIGHKQAVRTIVDAALLRENGMSSADIGAEVSDVVCYGGGGSTGRELRIGLRELLAVSKAEIADVSVAVSTDGNTAESPTEPVAAPISTPVDTAVSAPVQASHDNDAPRSLAPTTVTPDTTSTSPTPLMNKRDLFALAKSVRDLAISRDGHEPLAALLQSRQESAAHEENLMREVLNLGTAGSGKTALHHAAWKGSIESVKTLLVLGADVNQYSIGPGNYGKTAIFYALTQCRDDVVTLLLEHGANVRIVNNKGQTPRSLAVSHVSDQTIALIEAAEAVQDKEWLNFYSSNYCDKNTCFGDLDPRFHDLGNDLREQLRRGDIATLPRSINETTFAFRRGHYQSYNKMNHLLDDVVVSFLGVKQAGTPPLLEALRSPIPPLSATVLPDGTTFVDGVLGRITHIDAESQGRCILTLQPIRAEEGECWRLQRAALDGDYEVTETADAKCAEEAAKYSAVRLHFGPERDSAERFLADGALRHFAADLRVDQTIYANGTISSVVPGSDDPASSDGVLALCAHRVALFSTIAPVSSGASSGKKDQAKKSAPSEAIDAIADNAIVVPSPASYVTLSDIASSFLTADGTAPPVVVVNDSSSLALLESDVSEMVHEIQAGLAASDWSVQSVQSLPHVVGMDCEWRPGMVFVRRSAGEASASLSTPIIADNDVDEDVPEMRAVVEDDTGDGGAGIADTSTDAVGGETTGPAPSDYPVAVLQLATRRGVYLVDMQELTALGQTSSDEVSCSTQELLVRLSACLGQLFQHPEIVKLGFKGAADFEKLACSYPEMACFRRINSVIDTCTLAQQSLPALIRTKKLPASVLQGKPLKQLGLSRLCQVVLDGKGLDKAQQCSAWHLRPLTPEQMQYAALDAATLLFILDFFTHRDFAEKGEPVSVESLLLHKLYRTLVFNIKFSITPAPPALLEGAGTEEGVSGKARGRRSGPGKTVLGMSVVSQQWVHTQAEPADYVPPPQTEDNDVPGSDALPATRSKGKIADSYAISEAVTAFLQSSVSQLGKPSAASARDFLGLYIGQGKETCIAFAQALLHQGTADSGDGEGEVDDAEEAAALTAATASTAVVPQGRKQGNMLLLKNTMLLFVNCTNGKLSSKAKKEDGSKFFDQGKFFTWTVQGAHVVRENSTRATKTRAFLLDGLLHGALTGTSESTTDAALESEERSILVFVRQNAAPYVFCGRCGVAALTAVSPRTEGAAAGLGGTAVKVVFQLLEHEALIQNREGEAGVSLYKQMIIDHR